jgi:hypothetical protein
MNRTGTARSAAVLGMRDATIWLNMMMKLVHTDVDRSVNSTVLLSKRSACHKHMHELHVELQPQPQTRAVTNYACLNK